MSIVTLAPASAGYPRGMNTSSDRASARRAVPELVAAQVSGAFAGLLLALAHTNKAQQA